MQEHRSPEVINADRLWNRVRDSLLGAEKAVIAIIETEAWKPLGYKSFAEAWGKEMDGVTIAAATKAAVIYQLLTEGLTPIEITDTVTRVAPETAEGLKRQKDNGVPADKATTTEVRRRQRKLPGPWKWLRLKVDGDTHRQWARIAKRNNTTVAQIALPAIEAAFKELT